MTRDPLSTVPAGASFAAASSRVAAAEASFVADAGQPGRRMLIKGGIVMSMDDAVGNFVKGDVLIEGAKILEVGPSIDAPDATVIDAAGKIVIPGFIDTHHHQFETALRSSCRTPSSSTTASPRTCGTTTRRCC